MRPLGHLSLALLGTAVACVVALHVVRPQVSPIERRLSEYALGPYSWLMDTAFAATAGGLGALAIFLTRSPGRPRLVPAALVVAAVSLVLTAMYQLDSTDNAARSRPRVRGHDEFGRFPSSPLVPTTKERTVSTHPVADHNLDGYGTPPIGWQRVLADLEGGYTQAPDTGGPNRHTTWLATTNPDGTPHVMPVGSGWVDGGFWFTSGPSTRKSRNLAHNPACVITVSTHQFDLVAEGSAARVTDEARLQQLAAIYREDGWPARVEGDAFTAEFSAPSAGPPPWYLYHMEPTRLYALGTAEPYGATRFDL